jgi:hypothetical protein
MKLLPGRLLWLALTMAALFPPVLLPAQSAIAAKPSANARATIAGIVTKEAGSEPVKKAVIELIAESQADGSNYTAVTSADGSFQIDGIVPGRYHLFVERTGYLEVEKRRPRAEGRVLTLSAGQELKDLAIRLQAAAVVTGRVTDEDGDPMANAQVSVLRQTFLSGHCRWEQVGSERTNDLGEYRVAGLAAGNYFVSVTPPPDFKSLIDSGSRADDQHNTATDRPAPTSYQTTYYPGTRDRSGAAPIQLRAGDEFPANFSLAPSPTMTVRGSVVGLPPGATASIMLQSHDLNMVLSGAEVRKDGTFEVRDVAPGAYTIVATVEDGPVPMSARESLQVSSGNLEGLRLAPQPGSTVRGHVRFIANASQSANGPFDLGQLFLILRPADGDDEVPGASMINENFSSLAHVTASGSVEWQNVPAGHYHVELAGDASGSREWFVKSAIAGGSDLTEAGITAGGSTSMLDVVVSGNGAIVEGFASNAKGEPVADAAVVAVPEARLRSRTDRFRSVHTDQLGRFSLRGLPPGNYTIFAWESLAGEAYYDPAFLMNYEGQGKTLHVNENEHTSLQLEVIPAEEDAAN